MVLTTLDIVNQPKLRRLKALAETHNASGFVKSGRPGVMVCQSFSRSHLRSQPVLTSSCVRFDVVVRARVERPPLQVSRSRAGKSDKLFLLFVF
jgi:hypothetical protein